jgi:hypothetical protein
MSERTYGDLAPFWQTLAAPPLSPKSREWYDRRKSMRPGLSTVKKNLSFALDTAGESLNKMRPIGSPPYGDLVKSVSSGLDAAGNVVTNMSVALSPRGEKSTALRKISRKTSRRKRKGSRRKRKTSRP